MLTAIRCDECGARTCTDMAVYRRVPHYAEAHWVVLVRMCVSCALRQGWRQDAPANPYFSSAQQFMDWLAPAS